jgi:putative membrane protein
MPGRGPHRTDGALEPAADALRGSNGCRVRRYTPVSRRCGCRPGILPLNSRRVPLILLALYGLVWSACAIRPLYPADWLLENVLVFVFVPLIAWHGARSPVSNRAYVALFVFFCLHAVGSHYTYAEVPYDRWWQTLTGASLNELLGFRRNHYDRLVHFAYGLLVTPIWLEILRRGVPGLRGIWLWLLPLSFMMSHSMAYELVEWAAALTFGGDLGQAYLGTQGDVWDAHWDMFLATLGSALTLAAIAPASARKSAGAHR